MSRVVLDRDAMDAAKLVHAALDAVSVVCAMSPAALHAAAAFVRGVGATEGEDEKAILDALAAFWEYEALKNAPPLLPALLLPGEEPVPFRYAHSAWPEAFPIPVEALIRATSQYNRRGNPGRTEDTVRGFIESYGEGDAYLLPNVNGDHCLGYRYGSKGHQYLSFPAEPEDLAALYTRYAPKEG